MNLEFSDASRVFREQVRAWMSLNVPSEPLLSLDTSEGFNEHRKWEEKLASGNWSMVTWPKEYGGRGCSLVEWLIFEEEYYRAGAPLRVNQNGIFLLGPTLMEYGTAEQKARFLGAMSRGEEVWAQAWSEPNAGSDMAAIRATARLEGDSYVINGQKTWSTRAVYADWAFSLLRTGEQSTRHNGLSFILIPLSEKGVTVRPIRQLNGLPGFAEIFFDDVRVPIENRIGAEGDGWRIAMSTAGFERGLLLRSPARFQETAAKLLSLYRLRVGDGADYSLEDKILDCYLQAEAYAISTYHTACKLDRGEKIGPEASCNKIFWTELDLRMHYIAMSLLGSEAEVLSDSTAEVSSSRRWIEDFVHAHSAPIYAGTNEIQRNIISERVLGMPRC